MSPNELRWLDDLADRLFNQLNIDVEFTKHFFDRANDERGDYRDRQGRQHEQGITAEELAKVFVAAYKQAADQNSKFVKVTDIPANAEATIRDHFTKLNIPFVMKKAGGQKVLTPKTVMRKDNFANPPGTKSVPVNSKDVALDENLHKWFKEKWVRFGPDGKIRGDCARGDDSEGKPKCLPQSKAHSLGKKGRASAASRKRREDPNPERSGKAINVNTKKKSNEGVAEGSWKKPKFNTDTVVYDGAKANGISIFSAGYHPDIETAWIEAIKSVEPGAGATMVKSFEQWAKSQGAKTIRAEALQPSLNFWKKMGFDVVGNPSSKNRVPIEKHIGQRDVAEEQHSCPHCGGEMVSEELMNEKKDACYYKVKSRYKVWPSAYASGALVKCRKKGADSWGNGGKSSKS